MLVFNPPLACKIMYDGRYTIRSPIEGNVNYGSKQSNGIIDLSR